MRNVAKAGLFAVIVASWVLLAVCYSRMPEQIPVHWNLSGQVDGWGDKTWAAFLFPGLISFTAFLAFVLPAISPKGFRLDGSSTALFKVLFWISLYLLVAQWLVCQASQNPDYPVVRWLFMATGGLLVAVGNLLSKFPKNFFVGIRTPWTLANDVIWERTHRLARLTFSVAGLVMMVAAALDQVSGWLLGLVIGTAAVIPVIYSFLAYRQKVGFTDQSKGGP